jgi:hypothetical protein
MPYTFNGATRRIILDPGTVQLDLIDLYSRWLDWARVNPQFLQAFRVSGGDPDGTGGFTGRYIFLMNGWTIVPQSANHTLNAIGNLYRDPDDTSGNPLVSPVAGYTVNVIFNRSAQAQGISISGTTLTPAQIWAHPIDNATSGAARVLWRIAKLLGLTSESVTAKDDGFVRVGTGSDINQPITVNPDGSRTLGGSP